MPNQPTYPLIASPRNPRIMQIRKLATRKERSRSGLFFAEGIRLVAEAIRSGSEIASLIVAPDLLTSDFAHDLLSRSGPRCASARGHGCGHAEPLGTPAPPGPRGGGAPALAPLATVRPGDELCWVALDAPQDPATSAPSSARSTRLAAGLILLGDATDPYHPAAVRASMGAICHPALGPHDVR